mgnify:CR=1 FL=1
METYARKAIHKGTEVCELSAGGYYAIVAHGLGSNVLRFRDEKRGMEIFRYNGSVSIGEIMNAPNRFEKGVLHTSDATYRLPVNEERFGNHLHGFIQKRAYTVKELGTKGNTAFVENEYVYDEKDFFFNCFPVKFTVRIRIELSDKGLSHKITLINQSDKMMPISIATHTTINAPFVDGKRAKLTDYDKKYINGTCPVLRDICNDMYSGGTLELDGKPFHGTIMTDTASGKTICNEVDEKYKFWIVWNHEGFMNYFCPEPMTAQVNAPNLDMPAELSGYEELAPGKTYTATQRFFTMG